jgi:VCBS repeat-containing protein
MKQAQTSVKVSTITAAAKDDLFTAVSEDGGHYTMDVLLNDPGSSDLYSVDQHAASFAGTAQFPVSNFATLARGATISIQNGQLVYYVGGAAFQNLGAGVVGYDTFVYTIRMANGALSTATATVAVTGVNDAASITGDTTGGVTEDGGLTTGGSLAVSDVDTGENVFGSVGALAGTYGDFTFVNGAWTYTLRNGDANVQSLRGTDVVSDTLQVSSLDGTDTETISVAVNGTNDVAFITGDTSGGVTEDGGLTTGGSLAVSDVDTGENVFGSVGALAGTYGDFTFDAGAWTYTLRNGDTNVQALVAGQTVSDTLQVQSLDGTASQAITVAINGADEPPPPDPVYPFTVNRQNVTGGVTTIEFVNGVAVLDYFTANDSVSWGNGVFSSINEVNAGGNTSISYQWQTGNKVGEVTLVLIGVSDVNIDGNTLTMA